MGPINGNRGAAALTSTTKANSTGYGQTRSFASSRTGKKSIDDFCHLFHGAPSTPPVVKTYTFDEVINALNQVAPYDWRGFWTTRLTTHDAHAPLGGIQGSGWKLVYDENRSEIMRTWEESHREMDASFSVGILIHEDGEIEDTVEESPAASAGIGPGMKVVAVNGRALHSATASRCPC